MMMCIARAKPGFDITTSPEGERGGVLFMFFYVLGVHHTRGGAFQDFLIRALLHISSKNLRVTSFKNGPRFGDFDFARI